MPDLTDDIEAAAAEPLSASVDGQQAAAHPLPDLIAADKYLKGATALTGENGNGGQKSGWRNLRMARSRGSSAVE